MQHKSNRTLCPVKAWGKLIALILLYKNTTELTPIRYFEDKNIPNQMSTEDMIVQIREACKTIGEHKLGFIIDIVGTHSIRTGFTIQLHLAGAKDHILML